MNRFIPHPASPWGEGLIVWLSALATLAVFSFLYKENRVYRVAEHILLGLGIGFAVATTITDILLPKWWNPMAAGWRAGNAGAVALGVITGVLGMMWYGVYFKRTVWLSRLVMGITIGAGAGLAFKAELNEKLPQIIASFKSPYVPAAEATAFNNSVSNVVFVVILFCVLAYFFFSFDRKNRALASAAGAGRVFLMITFGVFFGNTIMTRMSVFIERIWFLLTQWLGLGRAA
jgi:hypothetical protein